MGSDNRRFKYLCAFAHYTGRRLAIGTQYNILDRPITPLDISAFTADLQQRGFRQAMIISFSLIGSVQN